MTTFGITLLFEGGNISGLKSTEFQGAVIDALKDAKLQPADVQFPIAQGSLRGYAIFGVEAASSLEAHDAAKKLAQLVEEHTPGIPVRGGGRAKAFEIVRWLVKAAEQGAAGNSRRAEQ